MNLPLPAKGDFVPGHPLNPNTKETLAARVREGLERLDLAEGTTERDRAAVSIFG